MEKMQFIPIITEWQNLIMSVKGVERRYEKELLEIIDSKPIKIITGFRRAGKSFLVQRIAQQVIKRGVFQKENVLYINFEEYRYSEIMNIKELDGIIQMFIREMAGPGKKLLIFDEIQKIPDWDKLIRTLYEKMHNCVIIITGSNSSLLSSEIGSNLAGRFIEVFILPFSFSEYLLHENILVKNEMDFYKQDDSITSYFHLYLRFGGLPEVFSIHNEKAKYSYMEGILSKVILDDIIKRYHVRNTDVLENILKYLFLGTGKIVSFSRITNHLKNFGFEIKNNTVCTYVDYIINTFCLYQLGRFDWKLQRVFSGNKKFYAVDTGIINLYDNLVSNYSRLLENIVYLKLFGQSKQVFFGFFQNKEIDFITKDREGGFRKYQVCAELHHENKKRELSAFITGNTHLDRIPNILLTMEKKEETIEYQGIEITKKYLVKWLLDV